jgi:hypothetical protein
VDKLYRYVTIYEEAGVTYAAHVDAADYDEAERLCLERGLGEEVQGLLLTTVHGEGSLDAAERIAKGFAEVGFDEPPTADQFD